MSKLKNINDVVGRIWTTTTNYKVFDGSSLEKIENDVKYVEPKLRELHNEGDGSIIIISAPGAVGKTTFAKHICHKKKGIYWDLAKMRLGDNSFIGTIAKSFGTENLTNFLQSLERGEVSLFIDAFDEAEIISGIDGVDKFVRDVYSYCHNSPRPNVVLFSRSETAELLQLQLMEYAKIEDYSIYEIDYFDKQGAVHFVQHHLTLKEDLSFTTHKEPFERALDNIFETIGKGMNDSPDLWQDEDVRSFIGYAPVLQTIASYLHQENFEEVANKFSKTERVEHGVKVISEFIHALLQRENEKLINQIKSEFLATHPDWDQWHLLYNNKEQLRTILSLVAGSKRIFPEIDLPNWLEGAYREAIFNFLPNHPFLRGQKFSSPAFRDFTLGVLIDDDLLGQVCSDRISNGRFVVTSLFAYFYQTANNNLCKGTHVGFLYESALSRRSAEDTMLLTFIKEKEGDLYDIEIINPDGHQANNLNFQCILNGDNPLVIERRLINASIIIKSEIVLGRKEGSIELSDVEIRAGKIRFSASECFIKVKAESNVLMQSTAASQDSPAMTVKKIGEGKVLVNWPGAQIYPWADYYDESISKETSEVLKEFYILRRILSPFRKHGRDEFAKHSNFIENVIVGSSPKRQAMLSKLTTSGILRKDSSKNQYFVSEPELNRIGITWGDIKAFNMKENVEQFLLKL